MDFGQADPEIYSQWLTHIDAQLRAKAGAVGTLGKLTRNIAVSQRVVATGRCRFPHWCDMGQGLR